MDTLGADGWDLVSVVPYHASGAGTSSLLYVFKRPKA